jgi:hypothetical protein
LAELGAMPREQKITFGEMRESGVSRVDVFCSDYRCSRCTNLPADRWPDHVRLSDIEPQFVCKACGKRGADVRPDFRHAKMESSEMTVWIYDQGEDLKVFATEEVARAWIEENTTRKALPSNTRS